MGSALINFKSIRPGNHRLTDKEVAQYFLLSAVTMGAVIAWGAIVAIVNGMPELAWFVVPPTVACIAAPWYVRKGGRTRVAEHALLISALACVLGLGFYTGGRESGGLIWALFIPALAVLLTGRKTGIYYCVVCLVALIGIALVYYLDLPVPAKLSPEYSVKDLLFKAPLAMLAITILAAGIRVRLEAHHNSLTRRQQFDLVGRLTGSVAHDFNNLLAVIMGNLELLEEHLDQRPGSKQLLQDIRQATISGSDLIRNLQTLSEQRRLDPRPIPIATQINESLPLIRRAVAKDGIELSMTDDSNGAVANVDPAQFDSAVLNLCINARDALPSGGKIAIRVYCPKPGQAGGRQVVFIEIRDNGTGMTAEVLEQALQPFFSTKEAGDGSGLGLAMVQNFADGAGGEVALSSKPSQGTCVTLVLPKVSPQLATAPSEDSSVAAGGNEHVLAVDDEPSLRQICQHMLQSMGYRVSLAANAREAKQIIDGDSSISAVFTDLVMPGQADGYQLARWIYANHPGIAVLMTSGYAGGQPQDLAVPLLHKPYTRHDLADRLRAVLDAHSCKATAS